MLMEVIALATIATGGLILGKSSSSKKKTQEEKTQEAVEQAVAQERARQEETWNQLDIEKAEEEMAADPRSSDFYFGDKTIAEDGKSFAYEYDAFYDYTKQTDGDPMFLKELQGSTMTPTTAARNFRVRFASPYLLVSKKRSTTVDGKKYCFVIGDRQDGKTKAKYFGIVPVAFKGSTTSARQAVVGDWREYGMMFEVFNPYPESMPLAKIVLKNISLGGKRATVLGGDTIESATCAGGLYNTTMTASSIYQAGTSIAYDCSKMTSTDAHYFDRYLSIPERDLTPEYEVSVNHSVPAQGSLLVFVRFPLSIVSRQFASIDSLVNNASKGATAAEALCGKYVSETFKYELCPGNYDSKTANALYDAYLGDLSKNREVEAVGNGRDYKDRGDFTRTDDVLFATYDNGVSNIRGFLINRMEDPGMPKDKSLEMSVVLCSDDKNYIPQGSARNSDGGYGGGDNNGVGGGCNTQFLAGAKGTDIPQSNSVHKLTISNSGAQKQTIDTDWTKGYVTSDSCAIGMNIKLKNIINYASKTAELLSNISEGDLSDDEFSYVDLFDFNIDNRTTSFGTKYTEE